MPFISMGEGPAGKSLKDALAGNLCRCTGYGPILTAGERMLEAAPKKIDTSATVNLLKGIQRKDTLTLEYDCPTTGIRKAYFAPNAVDELARLAEAHPDATFLAGGTDVGLWVTKQNRVLETVIYVGEVAELRDLRVDDSSIEIGAGVTYAQAADLIAKHYPDFGELIRRFGGQQIRNVGTIGGNIANGSPIGDGMPALICGRRRPRLAQRTRPKAHAARRLLHRLRQAGSPPRRVCRTHQPAPATA